MWNLKYDTNELIYETETDSWIQRTDLWLPRREREWRQMNCELGISRCKLLYIEWANSKILLYSTMNCIQYPVINHCGSAGKESACNVGDLGLVPALGRSPGEGKGYPLQYSGLENSVDCIVHGVAKSRTQLSNFHFPINQNGKEYAKKYICITDSLCSEFTIQQKLTQCCKSTILKVNF